MKNKSPANRAKAAHPSEPEARPVSDHLYVMGGWVHGADANKPVEADPWLKAHKHGEAPPSARTAAPHPRS